jgi:hypothetical protein
MPYRISYISRSTETDEQLTEGSPRTEEFPTEPAALARARELLEDASCNVVARTVELSRPSSTQRIIKNPVPCGAAVWHACDLAWGRGGG